MLFSLLVEASPKSDKDQNDLSLRRLSWRQGGGETKSSHPFSFSTFFVKWRCYGSFKLTGGQNVSHFPLAYLPKEGQQGGPLATEGRVLTIKQLPVRFPALTRVASLATDKGAATHWGQRHLRNLAQSFRSPPFLSPVYKVIVIVTGGLLCCLVKLQSRRSVGAVQAGGSPSHLRNLAAHRFQISTPPSWQACPFHFILDIISETGVLVTANERLKLNFHTQHIRISS